MHQLPLMQTPMQLSLELEHFSFFYNFFLSLLLFSQVVWHSLLSTLAALANLQAFFMLESISFLYPLFQYHFPTAKKDCFSIFATSIAHFNENSSLKVENGNFVVTWMLKMDKMVIWWKKHKTAIVDIFIYSKAFHRWINFIIFNELLILLAPWSAGLNVIHNVHKKASRSFLNLLINISSDTEHIRLDNRAADLHKVIVYLRTECFKSFLTVFLIMYFAFFLN